MCFIFPAFKATASAVVSGQRSLGGKSVNASDALMQTLALIKGTDLIIIQLLLLLLLFTPLEFFTSVLADGFSLEFE